MKRFAVFDIDGTLIRWQLYHAIADELARLGYIDKETFQKAKSARMRWKKREKLNSFTDYEKTLVSVIDEIITKLPYSKFQKAINNVFEEYKDQVYTYSRQLIKDLNKKGYLTFAISGSQIEIVEKIAKYYEFDDWIGSTYIRKNGKFTGEKIIKAHSKHLILSDLMNKHSCTTKGSVGVGDTQSDVSMLEMVERPIAFNPENKLLKIAKKNGWKIVVERKNVVYELRNSNGKYLLG